MPTPYYIAGHGDLTASKFRVPEGSTIVVMARPGEQTFGSMRASFCDILPDVLVNPNSPANRATLIRHFGSLAFFPAGSLCPNFVYSFPSCFGNDSLLCDWSGSGVIPIERLQELCYGSRSRLDLRIKVSEMDSPTTFDADSFDFFSYSNGFKTVEALISFLVTHLFQNSVAPSPDEVAALVTENPSIPFILKKFNDRDIQLQHVFEALSLKITQEELCSRMGAGVFFNFVCRPDYLTGDVFNVNRERLFSGAKKAIGNYSTVNPRMQRRSSIGSNALPLLKEQIAEAELFRKPAIRNWVREERRSRTARRSGTARRSRTARRSGKSRR